MNKKLLIIPVLFTFVISIGNNSSNTYSKSNPFNNDNWHRVNNNKTVKNNNVITTNTKLNSNVSNPTITSAGGYFKKVSTKKQIVMFGVTFSDYASLNDSDTCGIYVYSDEGSSLTAEFSTTDVRAVKAKEGRFYCIYGENQTIVDDASYYAKGYVISNGTTYYSPLKSDKGNYTDEYILPTTFKITVNATTGGTVSGGGNYSSGDSATVVATPSEGYSFDGWYENDIKISGATETYTFTANSSRTLTAKFKEDYYKEVDYIQSSGTQYIDVGLTFNRSQPTAEIKFYDYYAIDHAHSGNLFGCYNGKDAWNNGWGLYNGCYATTSQYWIHYNSNTAVNSTCTSGTVKLDRNKLYYNGSLIYTQGSVDSYQCNNTLYLLSGNFGSTTVAYKPSLKLQYFKFWLGDDLKRDMIPCVLTSNIPASKDSKNTARSKGTVGMWDKVTDKFYGNIGTGAFTSPE